jgi:hypothetical protein
MLDYLLGSFFYPKVELLIWFKGSLEESSLNSNSVELLLFLYLIPFTFYFGTSFGDGSTIFLNMAVKLPIMQVEMMTRQSIDDTITFLFLKWTSSRFSTRPKAMHPLMKAA